MVYDGHQPEYPGDFTSVERMVDEITAYLKERGVSRLDAAYGCSLGGACLTRMLALVIIEGLTMYLSEADVKRIFDVIAGRFPNATVFVETMNPMVVKRFKKNPPWEATRNLHGASRMARLWLRCCRISGWLRNTA